MPTGGALRDAVPAGPLLADSLDMNMPSFRTLRVLLGAAVWLAAGPAAALTDANGQTPRAAETLDTSTPDDPDDKITLDERVFSPSSFFRVYFNDTMTDPIEGTTLADAERAGEFPRSGRSSCRCSRRGRS